MIQSSAIDTTLMLKSAQDVADDTIPSIRKQASIQTRYMYICSSSMKIVLNVCSHVLRQKCLPGDLRRYTSPL